MQSFCARKQHGKTALCLGSISAVLSGSPREEEKEGSVGSFPISSLHQQVKDKTSDETNKVKELRLLPEEINVDCKTGRIWRIQVRVQVRASSQTKNEAKNREQDWGETLFPLASHASRA